MIQNKEYDFLSEISLKFGFFPFQRLKTNRKKQIREIVNCISYHRGLANKNKILMVDYTFF